MIDAGSINQQSVVAELREHFEGYETALINNDVEALEQYFWESTAAIRFGATEELYGFEKIAEFRRNRVIDFSNRTHVRKDIVTLGADVGVVTLEFTTLVSGELRTGRQTQVWGRFEGKGWRIVSAHISNKRDSKKLSLLDYQSQMSNLLNLPIDTRYASEVNAHLQVMAQVAAPLMSLQLEDTAEPAPEFEP